MINLFSSFDPNTGGLPLNWLSSMLTTFLVMSPFWLSYSQTLLMIKMMMMSMQKEFSNLLHSQATLVSVSLFVYIALNNFMGLFPYVFTSSTHFTYSMALALPLWLGHMVYSSYKQPMLMLAHLTPLGTPYALQPFMVLIEVVSSIIRPLTLAIRLAANMVAGHLLLTLVGSQAFGVSYFGLSALFTVIGLILLLESAVAIIQAYVFSILSTLYLSEVKSLELDK